MSAAVQQEPAYVIHRRPFRETSLLVDVFTLNAGRMGLVARGATRPKSPLKAQLQPFQPLLLDWTGRSDLKTLTQAEARPGPQLLGSRRLYSGFYINELLQMVLPMGDPHPELFAAYIDTLASLAHAEDIEPVLRHFEMAFAAALGYGFPWDRTTDTGEAVQAGARYGYDPEQGIVAGVPDAGVYGLPGEALLALAGEDWDSLPARRAGKQVMRALVDYLLQGRPLKSRALFQHRGGGVRE